MEGVGDGRGWGGIKEKNIQVKMLRNPERISLPKKKEIQNVFHFIHNDLMSSASTCTMSSRKEAKFWVGEARNYGVLS